MLNTFRYAVLVLSLAIANIARAETSLSAFELPADGIAALVAHGGVCIGGTECGGTFELKADGRCVIDREVAGKFSTADVTAILESVKHADFAKIRAAKFAGVCPTAKDDEEMIYYFRNGAATERLPGCTYALDEKAPPFSTLKALLPRCGAKPAQHVRK